MVKTSHWPRYTARTIGLLWAGWWTFFGLASGIGEGLDALGILMHTVMPGLIFGLCVAIAWRWERAGGILLIVSGLLALAWFPFATTLAGFLTLVLPPITAGILLSVEHHNFFIHRLPPIM